MKATLSDGRQIEYCPDKIGEGAMKEVYLTTDQKSVLCFYKNPDLAKDRNRLARLDAILNKYNPTLDPETGDYWQKFLCWPTGILTSPRLGVMTPVYPHHYFFQDGFCQGKEKESTWFVREKLRGMLPEGERGCWLNYLRICVLLARTIRRLHQAGLAHSDLSNKNVLVDPTVGDCLIIDIDSLVVPELFPPDVMGTRGYIAPEVLATVDLAVDDPQRHHASTRTDLHALAVLIYQYLLGRHPLEGPKVHSTVSAEEDDRLSLGSHALFIEHPEDRSNRPDDLTLPYTAFGPHLQRLFERAFIEGLHSPCDRASALEWEKGLTQTWDLLYPCQNSSCPSGWLVLNPSSPVCPFCHQVQQGDIPRLTFRSQRRPGQWFRDSHLTLYDSCSLYPWHIFDNHSPSETANRTPQAYCTFHEGRWLLVNQSLPSLRTLEGEDIPVGKAVELTPGLGLLLSQESHGRIATVNSYQ
ncbi:MAG: serine/threonine protein kinase [Kamptonema sp. SIO4C4]|nr:serine/threonine protein kinase [Kamptonema sp. SIO4C4]